MKTTPILARRLGLGDVDADGAGLKRVLDALEYAEAAVFCFKKEGKSALKKAKTLGFGAATPAQPSSLDDDDCCDEDDEP
jgi:hypothetical protein